jgi:trehalose-phosphatase
MKILNIDIDFEKFSKEIREKRPRLLLLDYDGTLAPFQVDPSQAFPYEGVKDLLDKIMLDSETRVIIITGRWSKDIKSLLPLKSQPEIWGTHGIERLKSNGTYIVDPMDPMALKGLSEADYWLSSWTQRLNYRYEQKPGSLALHWRGLKNSQIKNIKTIAKKKFDLLGLKFGLLLKEFDGGLELRVPGKNKGDAVHDILSEMPLETVSAYLGDDYTDEDAFKAIKNRGLAVLVRKDFRPTEADIWLHPPQELFYFLSKWI